MPQCTINDLTCPLIYVCIQSMKQTLNNGDLESLKKLSTADLERLWRQKAERKIRRKGPPQVRALLVRDIAWWTQEWIYSGMDAETQALLNTAVRQAGGALANSKNKPAGQIRKKRHKRPKLQTGVTLVRKWRGKTYKVKVIEDNNGRKCYRFAGQQYRSLTLIAQEITGAHWSGPRFFGLNRVRPTG